MKNKKLVFALTGICLLFFVAGSAMAESTPSAKFAATWSVNPALESVADIQNTTADVIEFDRHRGYTLATIKVPQDKELLVGVSAEIGLVTDTSIRGKEGGAAKALAGGKGYVTVFAVPRDGGHWRKAAPGKIVLNARFQELDATLGGVLQDTEDTGSWHVENNVCIQDSTVPDGEITVPCEYVFTNEEIGLLQSTTSAHHFNFVLPNMNQGVYDIKAFFTTSAYAEVDICENCDADGYVEGSAYAKAIINKTMLTVQQVRAAEGGLDCMDILEP